MGTRVVTVNDVLDGRVALDIECLDRVYLNVGVRDARSYWIGYLVVATAVEDDRRGQAVHMVSRSNRIRE
jgi:hypothetical protein